MKRKLQTTSLRTLAAALAMAAAVTPSVFGANQTWTNIPVSSAWTNVLNWGGTNAPGVINQTGNTFNNDIVTFNSPLFGGIGGAGNPILSDDGTLISTGLPRSRTIGSIIFDTPNVGAYVIKAQNPVVNTTDTNFPGSGVLHVCHNGSITMTTNVANSQTILGPLGVKLPGSTAGIYNLVNDSTNDVTLYIETITNYSATTRGTDFRLGGSNKGTNTVAHLSRGSSTGTAGNGLLKQGTGTWILPNENDFIASTAVRIIDGTLIAQNAGVFSLSGNVLIGATGVLQLDGVTLFQPTVTLTNGGNIRMNGVSSLNGVAVGNAAGTSVTLSTKNATDVFTVGTAFAVQSVVSAGAVDSTLNTAGPGTIVLATANTYVGNWSLGGGSNQITHANALNGKQVTVKAGTVLDTSALGSYLVTAESFGGAGTGTGVGTTAATINAGAGGVFDFGSKNVTLSFAPTSFTGDTTHPSLYVSQGTLSLSGNFFTVNNTSGTPLGAGTYRLIQQASGSVTVAGGPFAVVLGAGLAGGMIADVQVIGGNVNLVVSPHVSANLKWKGGNPNSTWDSLTTANFDNGVGFAQFGSGDVVTFDSLGSAFPSVDIAVTVLPSSSPGVLVDTAANNYDFLGAGMIAGPTALTKINAGTLTLGTVNGYLGGTTISNGTLRIGVTDAIPSAGPGNVSLLAPASIDLNGFNNKVNGLSGAGSVDNLAAASASILTVGNNNASGTLSGQIKSTSNSVALVKIGTGTLTLTASNTYSGGTTLSAGTLTVTHPNALGTNGVTTEAGTLNVTTNLLIASLTGTGGTVANNANASTNIITITGGGANTYGGNVINGSAGGLGISLPSGSLSMSGNNTYSGGTYVGSGATFGIPNAPAAVGGFVIATNGATLILSGGSGTPGTPNSITTLGSLTLNSGAEGKIWQAQFNGALGTTNYCMDPMSFGQEMSFSNFLGVVVFNNTNLANSNIRFFNGGGASGGNDTVFVFERANVHTRDAQVVRLGAIRGGDLDSGIGDQAGIVTWEIGGKHTTESFHGYVSGLNNSLSKVGAGGLTLDGARFLTNTVTLPDTSVVDYFVITNEAISYAGATTVSNGTLKIVAPNNLTNSSSITVAGTGAVLDITQVGYFTNQTVVDINTVEQATNTTIVTTGVLHIPEGKSLNGHGTVMGSVTTTPTSTVTVGAPLGTLAISGSISLNGTVNMGLNRSNPGQNSDRLTAASITGAGATLNVTNAGPTLIAGAIFQLFGGPVTAFTTVNLPSTDATGQIPYTWQNNIAVNGSITLLSGMSAAPTSVAATTITGTNYLSWPVDHTGWTLQSQTNSLAVGLNTNWTAVAGSTATNAVAIPLSITNPATFYRLNLSLP